MTADTRRPVTGWTRADSCAAVVVVMSGLLLLAAASRVFLRGDDWVILSLVSAPDFGPADLLVPYANHLMPVPLSVFWLARALGGPAPWWLLVLMGLAVVVLALTFTWLALRAVVGARAAAAVPFAVAAWSPAVVAMLMWPAPMVALVGMWAASAGALWAYLVGRRTLVVIFIVVGLLFSEQTLLTVVLLVLISGFWFRRRPQQIWRQDRGMWRALVVVVGLYVITYLFLSARVDALAGNETRGGTVLEGLILTAAVMLPAMIVHAPWQWTANPGPQLAGPLWLLVLVAAIGWIVVLRARRGGWRMWAPLAGLLFAVVVVLTGARLVTFGPGALLNPYYFTVAITPLALTLAAGYLPSGLPIDQPGREPPRRRTWLIAGVVLAVSSVLSVAGYARAVPSMPSREYLANASSELRDPTLNTSAPRQDFGVFLFTAPWDTAEHALDFVGVPGNWQRVAEDPFMIGPDGHRVPLALEGIAFDVSPDCVPVESGRSFDMPLAADPSWPTYAMTYRARSDGMGSVELGSEVLDVPVRRGLHTVYFTGDGKPGSVRVQAPGTCVEALRVGQPHPS